MRPEDHLNDEELTHERAVPSSAMSDDENLAERIESDQIHEGSADRDHGTQWQDHETLAERIESDQIDEGAAHRDHGSEWQDDEPLAERIQSDQIAEHD